MINDLKRIYKIIKSRCVLALINEEYISENEEKRAKSEYWAELGNFEIHAPKQYREFLSIAGLSEIEIHEELTRGWIASVSKK